MSEICHCIVPEMCPNCRNLISTQVMRIKRALKENPDVKIHFKCFNKRESKKIKKSLSFDDLKRVYFSWYVFYKPRKLQRSGVMSTWLKITKLDKSSPSSKEINVTGGFQGMETHIEQEFSVKVEFWMCGENSVLLYKGIDTEDYFMVRTIQSCK